MGVFFILFPKEFLIYFILTSIISASFMGCYYYNYISKTGIKKEKSGMSVKEIADTILFGFLGVYVTPILLLMLINHYAIKPLKTKYNLNNKKLS